MAKPFKQIQQYELKVPGIGFHTTRYGSLMFKFNSQNILKLRDALARAAQYLTELAVTLIEQEREAEIRELEPPPNHEQRHQDRLLKAKTIPQSGVQKQIDRSIERARSASRRAARLAVHPDSQDVVQFPKPLTPVDMARKIIEKTEPTIPEQPKEKTIVSGGFEPDDGLLGEPPASIR